MGRATDRDRRARLVILRGELLPVVLRSRSELQPALAG
jgi:hypothetical protein